MELANLLLIKLKTNLVYKLLICFTIIYTFYVTNNLIYQTHYQEGNITLKDGTILGKHHGLYQYTIGQRKGLNISYKEPLYVIELKKGAFKSSYLGQLCTYLRLVDDQMRKPHENPSIGIVLCKSADKKYVEYVIQDYDKPLGVATYKTSDEMPEKLKQALPDIEELKKLL